MPRMLSRVGIAVALILAPSLALAAATDVTLSTDTVLSVAGITLNVSGSSASIESITVDSGNFSVTMQSGSSFQVTAPGLNRFTASTLTGVSSDICSSSQSLLAYSPSTSVTVTITPSSTLCSSTSSGGGSGSTGGGGSPSPAPVTPVALASVNLGSAANFTILSKSGISSTGVTSITGDIGVSPAAASYITGFDLTLPAAGAYSTSARVSGKVYAPDYAVPTPATITTAISDMETAYVDAAGRTSPTATELGAGNIGGMTLAPGLYKWSTDVTIPTDLTLAGGANDVWIFQIAENLLISSAKQVVLSGGARAANIFWQVAGQTTIGTTAVFNGNILDQTAIVLNTGATLNGRALAQTAVTLDAATVTNPGTASAAATPATPAVPGVSPAVPATPATPSSGNSSSGLSAGQIQSILDVLASFDVDAAMMASVRAALEGTTTGSVTSAAVSVFKANLTLGSLGSEVKALQQFLNAHGYTVAKSGAGSPGKETTKFGGLTKAALIKYQKAKGITPAVGYFGQKTRTAVNAGS